MSPMPTLLLTSDVGVSPTRTRRRFSVAYKRDILRAVAACTTPGEIGALLRREGLYSSQLTAWRAADRRGALTGPVPRRGPVAVPLNPQTQQLAQLERALAQATRRAERAELLVEAQQKFSPLIARTLPLLGVCTETPS